MRFHISRVIPRCFLEENDSNDDDDDDGGGGGGDIDGDGDDDDVFKAIGIVYG